MRFIFQINPPSHPPIPPPVKKIGCLILLILLFVVFGVIGGAVFWGYKTVDETVGWETAREALSGGTNTIKGLIKGELRLRVPDELWQNEVRRVFPVTEAFTDYATVEIGNPQFIADADPAWLRVALDLTVTVTEGGTMTIPGRMVVRTQLRYDPETLRVLLDQAELAEFSFVGELASMADALRPVLEEVIASELADFEVLDLSEQKDLPFLRESAGYLKDVLVENHGVVVVIGRQAGG